LGVALLHTGARRRGGAAPVLTLAAHDLTARRRGFWGSVAVHELYLGACSCMCILTQELPELSCWKSF
jgi:hypothetical protein